VLPAYPLPSQDPLSLQTPHSQDASSRQCGRCLGWSSTYAEAADTSEPPNAHVGLDVVEVPDEGHAPLLTGDQIIGRIAAFANACDTGNHA
jgi:hypothetical protein